MRISEDDAKERVSEGHLRVLVTFEIVGTPKEHVETTLKKFLKEIVDEKALGIVDIHSEKANELEEDPGFFSAFAEVEMTVETPETLTSLAFNYTPASIEMLEPAELVIKHLDLQNWFNDLLSQLHYTQQTLRGERQRISHLGMSIMNLLRNMVTILLASGPKDAEELARLAGTSAEDMERVLAPMSEEKIIAKKGKKWTLGSKKK